MRLSPLCATRFVGTDETTEVVFNGPTMELGGEFDVDELFDRVELSRPTAAALAAYAAAYRCSEIDARLIVSVESGGLVARQRKWPPRALSPAYEDAFNDDKTTYVFTRDGRNAVDGVTLSLERVHNLRFDRP
jgi:hypothetical protein